MRALDGSGETAAWRECEEFVPLEVVSWELSNPLISFRGVGSVA
jgi:hypothetical protein